MADATSDTAISPSSRPATSIFSHLFEITSIKTDPARWTRDWEKGLRSLSCQDVYVAFHDKLRRFIDAEAPDQLSRSMESLRTRALEIQKLVIDLWNILLPDFCVSWLLLEEKERRKHLMEGLQKTCESVLLGEDSRALCPEINVHSLLKDEGRGFVDFIRNLHKNLKQADSDALYTVPSQWWVLATPESGTDGCVSQLLTTARTEFIGLFAVQTGMSFLGDLADGSPGMDAVKELTKACPEFTKVWGEVELRALSKPIIRCENCAKSPDMFEDGVKFMLCSVCKAKLSFTVHYCSQACQKEDWKIHKKHCGKQKVSKRLKGTINDPFWKYPHIPDDIRSLPHNGSGVPLEAVGFAAPDPSYPRSPPLERQISLLTDDVEANYFLFDEAERPIPVEIPSMISKFMFRFIRGEAISSRAMNSVEVIAEYILNHMANHPRLSRQRILQQFGREYGEDMIEKILEFEESTRKKGFPPGMTYLDDMCKMVNDSLPTLERVSSKNLK